ncbi:glycoside hydrolase family 3 C-terminal domain-containing protein [Jatrophihabitans sp. YIM 134969]
MRRWTSAVVGVTLAAGAVAATASASGPAAAAAPATPIYLNRAYSPVERATDLVARMTLGEKAQQMNSSRAPAIPRLGVATWGWWNESNHGVNASTLTPSGNATTLTNTTSYPSDLSMGSTWNPTLVRTEAGLIGDEARDVQPFNTQNMDFYAPTVNLSRDPRWGRNDESWSEDPNLTAALASQYVNGLQGQDANGQMLPGSNGYYKAIATLKHYAANNSEVNRLNGNSVMSQRDLREYYTSQFAQIVEQAHPGSIMSSYNEVNGVPAAASVQLMDTLARQTFSFDGYFTSDCDAVYEIQHGHQWVPPNQTTPVDQYGRTAYAITAGEDLDCNAGYSDQYSYGNTVETAIAQKIKTETDTFNENDVDVSAVRLFTARIETGEFDAESQVPWVQAARKRLGGVTWTSNNSNNAITETPERLAQARKSADEAIVLLNNAKPTKGGTLLPLKVPAAGKPYKIAVMGYYGHPSGGIQTGGYSSIQAAAGQANNVDPYQGIKSAVQAVNPDAVVDYLPGVTGGTSAASLTTVDADSIARAKGYDAVIVVAGTDGGTSAEDHDRTSLALPGAQAQMISQAEAANPRTVVYLETVGQVDVTPFKATSPALLWSSYNGQRQGEALADVLLGKVDASGRLPFTWYKNESDIPAITDYNLHPTATTKGRTYQYFDGPESYPFGYGLSYSTFGYSDISVSQSKVTANDTITVKATVRNNGIRVASEVPQLYVTTPFAPVSAERPAQRLEGFSKITLNPGQSKTVTFSVPASKLAFFDEASNTFVVDNGKYGLQVGPSSASIKLTSAVTVTGKLAATPTVVTAKPIQTGDKAAQIAQRVYFDVNTTIDPQLTVSTTDQSLYGYVTKGQSKPLPAGTTVSYSSNRPAVVAVQNGKLKAAGPGIATVTATVTLNGKSASTSFPVDVATLQITSNPSVVFPVGGTVNYTVTTHGSPTPKLTLTGALPAGVTFEDNGNGTATISGPAPAKAGVYPVTVTARNGVSPRTQQTLLLYVGTAPVFTSPSTAQFVVGTAGSFTVATRAYPPAALTSSGTLPSGLTFTDNGDGTATISGTPATASGGSYTVTVTANNGLSPNPTQSVTITVLNQAPTATTAVLTGTTTTVLSFGTFRFTIPVSGIGVHLYAVGSSTETATVATVTNGSYEFDGVAPGDYQVGFVDPTGRYATQWYAATATGSPTRDGASVVHLTAGQATTGVNATLVTA